MKQEMSLITVSVASGKSEYVEAVLFINKAMREHFKCDPPPTVGVICIARVDDEICGSFAIAGAREDKPFPIEEHYQFNQESTPIRFLRTDFVQGTRWNCTRNDLPKISTTLLYFAFKMAFDLGKKYMLIEAKPATVRYLGRIGIHCHPIPDAILLPHKVQEALGEEGLRYFIEPPLPTLYMLELEPSIRNLSDGID